MGDSSPTDPPPYKIHLPNQLVHALADNITPPRRHSSDLGHWVRRCKVSLQPEDGHRGVPADLGARPPQHGLEFACRAFVNVPTSKIHARLSPWKEQTSLFFIRSLFGKGLPGFFCRQTSCTLRPVLSQPTECRTDKQRVTSMEYDSG